MKTFISKEQFVEYFNIRIKRNIDSYDNKILVKDFERVKDKEFVFSFVKQTLENQFNVFKIKYFFEAVQKIEFKNLAPEIKIKNIIEEFNEMKETDYSIVFNDNIDRFVYKIMVNDSFNLNKNDKDILDGLINKYYDL